MNNNPSQHTNRGLTAISRLIDSGMSVKEIAGAVGCTPRAVQYYLAGARNITLPITKLLEAECDKVCRNVPSTNGTTQG